MQEEAEEVVPRRLDRDVRFPDNPLLPLRGKGCGAYYKVRTVVYRPARLEDRREGEAEPEGRENILLKQIMRPYSNRLVNQALQLSNFAHADSKYALVMGPW